VKKLGKRTLALTLALIMALSLSSISVLAGGAETVKVGETKKLTANTDRTDVTWSSSDSAVASVESDGTVKGVKAGAATITASAPAIPADPANNIEAKEKFEETWQITVPAPVVTAFKADKTTYATSYGTKLADVTAALKKDVKVTAVYDNGVEEEVKSIDWTSNNYDGNTLGDYDFTANITDPQASVAAPTVKVTVGKLKVTAKSDLGSFNVIPGTTEADAKKALPTKIDLGNGTEILISDLFGDWTCDKAYSDRGGATNNFTAKVNTNAPTYGNYENLKNLTATVIIVDGNNQDVRTDCDIEGMTLKAIIDELDRRMNKLFGSNVTAISLDELGARGGVLYEDAEQNYEVKEDEYTAKEARLMMFVPDGTGMDFTIDYTAVGSQKAYKMSGTITIESEAFIIMEATIGNDEILEFDTAEINKALEDLEGRNTYDFEVISINGISVEPRNYGNVYVDYDASAKSNKSASGTYYADPNTSRNQSAIDDLTFVPNAKLSQSVVATIKMTAYVSYTSQSNSGKTTQHKDSFDIIYRVNIVDKADITLEVKNGEYVVFDEEAFAQFLEENKTGKNTDVTLLYVTFEGLPNTNKLGRIYDNYDKDTSKKFIANPDGKKYYYSDSDEGDYALETLTYVTGTAKDHTIRVDFKLHYLRAGSRTVRSDIGGTLDIIVGAKQTSSGSGKVVDLYNSTTFRDSDVYAFKSNLFGDDVDYVVFTAQPTGGKLVYNFGKADQTDVKLNTNYYTSGRGNLLSNVTLVPTYGNALRCVAECKAVTTKNKATNYRITLTITRSTASRYFNDVTAASYSAYADSIDLLRNMGITTGTTATTFEPAKTLTRGEWITMLYRAAGSPSVTGTNRFTDVPAWCKDAVQWAVNNNVTQGTSTTTFAPNQILTRQEIAQFMYNWVIKMKGVKATNNANLSNYTDGSSVASWAQDAMKWALGNGYFDTVSGRINATGTSNRAEAADSLHRLIAK